MATKEQLLFEELLRQNKELAYPRDIAFHLGRVALYELTGPDALYPTLREKYITLEARMKDLGKPIILMQGFRSAKDQNDTYASGRTAPGAIVTNAQGLESYHQYGLALDVCFRNHGYNPPAGWWDILGTEGQKLKLEWGGSWKEFPDRPHFELHPSGSWKVLKPFFGRT